MRYFLAVALILSLAANGFALYQIHQLQRFDKGMAERESSDHIDQQRRLDEMESNANPLFAPTPPTDFTDDISELKHQTAANASKLTRLCQEVHASDCFANY